MLNKPLHDLEAWVIFFSNAEMPILRQTARRLEEARRNIDRIGGRDIAAIVLQDPLMAIRVLACIQPFRGKHLRSDITTIAKSGRCVCCKCFTNASATSLSRFRS